MIIAASCSLFKNVDLHFWCRMQINMKTLLRVFILLLLITGIFYLNPEKTVKSSFDRNLSYQRAIIKFRPLTPAYFKNKLVEKYRGHFDYQLQLKDTYLLKIPLINKNSVLENLGKSLWVDYVEEDYQAKAAALPNDPFYPDQWGLKNINAQGAWDADVGSESVVIAILDTGINKENPDLKNKVIASVSCLSFSCRDYQTSDPAGHGTHVAGIAAAVTNNNEGIAGLSWNSKLMSVKVLDDGGSGYYSQIADGIIWAADNGADVINLSLGGSFSSFTLKRAVDYAWGKGVVIAASAGNSGSSRQVYPANYSNVISVAAVDEMDEKADFSNYGYWVDVAAPGVSIISTYRDGYEYFSGTSMATPFVSGLSALIISQNPDFDNSQVVEKIEESTDAIEGTGSYWIYGRINACKALGCEDSGEVTPTPSVVSTPTLAPTATLTPTPIPASTFTPTPEQTSTPTPLSTPTNTPVPTDTPTPTLTVTPTDVPSLAPSPTEAPSPTPTSADLPWWCKYIPDHYTCK